MGMIVPDFWAEGRVQARYKGRQVTVRRLGWSNASQQEAQSMADDRAQDALTRILAGEKLRRRDWNVPYNGGDGVPIREEVVARHGEEVITRNSYGALCLNTPHVLFADIDAYEDVRLNWRGRCLLALLVVVFLAAPFWWTLVWSVLGSSVAAWLAVVVIDCAVIFMSYRIKRAAWSHRNAHDDGPRARAAKRVEAFLATHPDWGLRMYTTPAGLRLLVTHRLFDPLEPAVAEFFAAVGVDSVYADMCRNQRCFRARLSAKPWRIPMDFRLKSRPAPWPAALERQQERAAWLHQYDMRARAFAACRFERALGNGFVDLSVQPVVRLHDDTSRALHNHLPLA